MAAALRFLIIDDDKMNNFICNVTIKNCFRDAIVTSFEQPVEALGYIRDTFARNPLPTVLLLDLNMPVLSGWDVLDELEKCDYSILNQLRIYILSSSVDQRDIERAKNNPHVVEFISKPLKKEKLMELFRPGAE